jgi:teichuronic acid biosynthesis glycosyltransferase TuaG
VEVENRAPFISVIVTTYNRKELLTETINSILSQSHADFELIIVDNYSSYNFMEHVQSFKDNRIRPYQNHNNGIIAVNRNYGIEIAKGEYVAFCDDDDVWHFRKLETQIAAIESHKTGILISTMAQTIGIECEFGEQYYGITNLKTIIIKDISHYSNPIVFSSALVSKQAIIDVGGFDEDPSKIAVEDYDFWIKISKLGKFILIKEILTYYRIQDSNMSKNNKNQYNYSAKYYASNNSLILKLSSIKFKGKFMMLISSVIHYFCIQWFNLHRDVRLKRKSPKISLICYSLKASS